MNIMEYNYLNKSTLTLKSHLCFYFFIYDSVNYLLTH